MIILKLIVFLFSLNFAQESELGFRPKNELFRNFKNISITSNSKKEDKNKIFIKMFKEYVANNLNVVCVEFKDELGSDSICLKELYRELIEWNKLDIQNYDNVFNFLIKILDSQKKKYEGLGPQFVAFKSRNEKLSLSLMLADWLIQKVSRLEMKNKESTLLINEKVYISNTIEYLINLEKTINSLTSSLEKNVTTQNIVLGENKRYRHNEMDTYKNNKYLFEKLKKLGLDKGFLAKRLTKYSNSTNAAQPLP